MAVQIDNNEQIERINRNIVECKGRNTRTTCVACEVLIETLWNVKKKGGAAAAADIVY